VAGETDYSFGAALVERAAERARITEVEDVEDQIAGVLAGVLPYAHLFEFRTTSERGTIRGKVDKAIPTADLTALSREWLEKPSRAIVTVRRVLKAHEAGREGFT